MSWWEKLESIMLSKNIYHKEACDMIPFTWNSQGKSDLQRWKVGSCHMSWHVMRGANEEWLRTGNRKLCSSKIGLW